MEDYGSRSEPQAEDKAKDPLEEEASEESSDDPKEEKQKGGKLLIDEERAVGEIAWKTYHTYIKAIGAYWWTAFIFLSIVCVEGSRVTSSLFLGFWSQMKIEGFSQGAYMGVYAGESTRLRSPHPADYLRSRRSYCCCDGESGTIELGIKLT
jgi:hypothetical protein